jgi:pimeloyl-ACP methyl ester carboxylesterase
MISLGLWIALVAGGCGDEATAPRPSAPTLRGAVLDAEIDPSDSYVVVEATESGELEATSDEAMLHPESGELVTSFVTTVPTDTFVFQTGFTSSGVVVARTQFRPDPVDGIGDDSIAVTRMVGTSITDLTAEVVVVPVPEDDTLEGPDPLAIIPVFTGNTLIDAVAPYKDPAEGGGGGGGGNEDCSVIVCEMGLRVAPDVAASEVGIPKLHGRTRLLVRDANRYEFELTVDPTADESARGLTRRTQRTAYTRRDGQWLLESLESDETLALAGRSLRSHRTLRLRYIAVRRNRMQDQARERQSTVRADRARRPVKARQRFAPRRLDLTTSLPTVVSDCAPGYSSPGRGGSNILVVFQHGFMSSACTWTELEPVVNTQYRLAGTLVPSLPWGEPYDAQATLLRRQLDERPDKRILLIGHSNGGIISRRTAQPAVLYSDHGADAGLLPPLFGVITLNSPHLGAPAMDYPAAAVRATARGLAWPVQQKLCPFERGCGSATDAMNGVAQWIYEMNRDHAGVFQDMRTTGPFRVRIQEPAESFPRVAIISHSPKKWMWARMVGDMNCGPMGKVCGGRALWTRTNRWYKHLKKSALLNAVASAGFAVLAPFTDGATGSLAVYFGKGALQDGVKLTWLVGFDKFYRRFIAGGDDSDGIVPASSQTWPRLAGDRLIHIDKADSHSGSTKSPFVQAAMLRLLNGDREFRLPR